MTPPTMRKPGVDGGARIQDSATRGSRRAGSARFLLLLLFRIRSVVARGLLTLLHRGRALRILNRQIALCWPQFARVPSTSATWNSVQALPAGLMVTSPA